MSTDKMGMLGRLATLGAVGAVAGIAWRLAQRHRASRGAARLDLTRWEGEGGALAAAGLSPSQNGATEPTAPHTPRAPSNGSAGDAWPFPRSPH